MFKNMNIRTKLLAGFIAAVLITSIAGFLGMGLLYTTDKDYGATLVDYGFAQGDIGRLAKEFQAQRVDSVALIQSLSGNERQNNKNALDAADARVEQLIQSVKSGLVSEKGEQVHATLVTAWGAYLKERNNAILFSQNNAAEGYSHFKQSCTPLAMEVTTILDTMLSDKTSIGLEKSNALTAQTNLFLLIIAGVMVVSGVVAIVIALVISGYISKPIKACAVRMASFAQGDLHTEIATSNAKDELGLMINATSDTLHTVAGIIEAIRKSLGRIASGDLDIPVTHDLQGDFSAIEESIDLIVASLNDTLGSINQSAMQVSDGSGNVSGGAQELAQGATEQAESVERLAEVITQISAQVQDSADNAQSANVKVRTVGEELSASNRQMQEMNAAMADISHTSDEIGKIIKTIEDIAFQTNILALNAAVEAARAGAAGKGFAVVADEVRNLASKSAEAAKSTTELIETSLKAVQNGTHIAEATAKSLINVVSGSTQITEIIGKISVASTEQAEFIKQISQNIDQISSVVQTNSATAEESAAASEELSGQAELLKSLVGRFRLKEEHRSISLY